MLPNAGFSNIISKNYRELDLALDPLDDVTSFGSGSRLFTTIEASFDFKTAFFFCKRW